MKVIVRILLLLVGFSLMTPLVYWVGIIGIPVWAIPVGALAFLQLGIICVRGNPRFRLPDRFEIAILVFIISILLSTAANPPEGDLAVNKLFVYTLSFGLAVYAKRNFGRLFNIKHIVIFSYLFVSIEFFVCIIQYVTQSPIGNIGAYLGETQTRYIGGSLERILGFSRISGTMGVSGNTLANSIVALLPFVVASRSVFTKSRRVTLHYVAQRVTIAMAVITVLMTVSRLSLIVLFTFSMGLVGQKVYEFLRVFSSYTDVGRKTFRFDLTHFYNLVSVFVVAGLIFLLAFSNSRIQNAMESGVQAVEYRFSQIGEESSVGNEPIQDRYLQIDGAMKMFSDSPYIIGVGYRNANQLGVKTDVRLNNPQIRVHNAYFQFLAEGGFFAFISLVFITLYPLYLVYKSGKNKVVKYSLLASLLGIVIFMQSTTAHDSSGLAPIYMLIIGTAVGFADN